MNTYEVKFSKKAKNKWLFILIVLLFITYYPLIGFIEDYFYFGKYKSVGFYVGLIVIIACLCFIILYIIRLFKKVALIITDERITIYYYLLRSYCLPISNIDAIHIQSHKGKEYLIFQLNSDVLSKRNTNFVTKYFLNYLNKNGKALILPSADLAIKSKELVKIIMELKKQYEQP